MSRETQIIVRIPRVNGGHAHVRGTKVLVHDVVFRFMQGAGVRELAALYGVPESSIDAALRYELKRVDRARLEAAYPQRRRRAH
jgi:uncharacterized protein (DUF433 family)